MIDAGTLALLAVGFTAVAFLYASVGLGGASTYTAVLAIVGVGHLMIPTISLALNLVVTSIGMINFRRGGHLRPELVAPFLVASVPCAWLGGALRLSEGVFLWLLAATLVLVFVRIYLLGELRVHLAVTGRRRLAFSLALGGVLGFVAGAVGIGGGIYLVPLMIMFGLAGEKEAAATGTVFVWVTSFAGLASRGRAGPLDPGTLLPLMAVVAVGAWLGSSFGSLRIAPRTLQRLLGVTVLAAIVVIAVRLPLPWS